jgi:hypothetical protein
MAVLGLWLPFADKRSFVMMRLSRAFCLGASYYASRGQVNGSCPKEMRIAICS